MIETVLVFSLICFCLIAGYLAAQIQRVFDAMKMQLQTLQRIDNNLSCAIGGLSKVVDATEKTAELMGKPIEMPDVKPPGVYEIQPNGGMIPQVLNGRNPFGL